MSTSGTPKARPRALTFGSRGLASFLLLLALSVLSAAGVSAQTQVGTLSVTNPTYLAIDTDTSGTRWLYVSNHGDIAGSTGGVVYKYNLTTGSTTGVALTSHGTADGQFISPDGIAIDPTTHDLFVSDRYLNRVQRLHSDGTFVMKWGTAAGGAADEMHGPSGLALDSSGAIYIAEHGDYNGDPSHVGQHVSKYTVSATTATKVWRVGSFGSGDGQFNSTGPYGVALSGGSIYVADAFNFRIQALSTATGAYQSQFALSGGAEPLGLLIDGSGTLWAAETSNDSSGNFNGEGNLQQVQALSLTGTPTGTVLPGTPGTLSAFAVAIDSVTNKAYVSDYQNSRVVIYSLTPVSPVPVVSNASVSGTVGTAITAVTVSATNSPTSFSASQLAAYGLAIDASGKITGTPTATATNATVAVTATNTSGTSTPATLTLNIAPSVIVTTPAAVGPVATSFTFVPHTLQFQVHFSEPVTGVTTSSFVFTQEGLAAGHGVFDSVTQVDPSTYNLNITFIPGDETNPAAPGAFRFDIKASGSGIVGVTSGLPYAGGGVSAAVCPVTPHLEVDAPLVASFAADTPVGNTVNFVVTFNKGAFNLQPSNVTLTASSGATATLGAIQPAANDNSAAVWNIPVTFSGTGTISATLTGSNGTISDGNYNYYVGPDTSSAFTIPDNSGGTPPVLNNAVVSGSVGTAISPVQVYASGSPTSFTAADLATYGLTISNAGVISGTPTATAADVTVNVTAQNSAGTSAAATITLDLAAAATTGSAPVVSNATVTGTVGTAITPVTVSATNSPTSFSASGLAAYGLTISNAGVISGTPTTTATGATVTVTATNAIGTSNAATITLNLAAAQTGAAPAITSATSATATVGTAFQYQIVASNSPTSYAATTLAGTGLSLNATTGLISGTPTAAGPITTQITATNSTGASAPVTLTITVNAAQPVGSAPSITSSTVATATVGSSFSYQISATDSPTSYAADNLAGTGLAIDTATGVISGTPTTAGTITTHISATNAVGTSTPVTVTITVNPAATTAPVVTAFGLDLDHVSLTSAQMIVTFNEDVTGVDATDFAVHTQGDATATITSVEAVSATDYRVKFDYTGTNGSIQMAIKTSGTGIVDTASNAFFGLGITATPVIVVNSQAPSDPDAPSVVSFTHTTPTATGVNFVVTFSEPVSTVQASDFIVSHTPSLTVTNGPLTADVTGTTYTLPLSFTGSGSLSVYVVGGATTDLKDAAGNWFAGASSATLSLGGTVATPTITSANTATANVGTAFHYQIVATDSPTSFAADGLTGTGLAINTATGVISGTPTTAGTITTHLTASNSAGTSGTVVLTITVSSVVTPPSAPVISSATSASGTVGTAFSYHIVASGSPTSYSADNLAGTGLSLNATTGVISGTPVSAGTITTHLTATNAGGTSAAVTLTISVTGSGTTPPPSAPVISSAASASGTVGTAFSYHIVASGSPTSYSADNLAGTGLSLNATTGVISGTPVSAGTITTHLTATNAGGTSAAVTLTISVTGSGTTPPPSAPTITSATTASATAGSFFSYQITASPAATSYAADNLSGTGLSLNASTGTISGTPTAAGTITTHVTATGTGGVSTPVTLTISVSGAATPPPPPPPTLQDQHLVFQAPTGALNVGDSIALGATNSSGLPISYAVVSGPATVTGSTLLITGGDAAITVRAASAGNGTYAAATAQVTFTATKKSQVVSTTPIPAAVHTDTGSMTLDATSTSGLPITYTVISGPATVDGNTLTFTGTGAITLQVNQAGNDTYAPVSTTITVMANPIPRLVNISSRLRVSAGDADGASIAGFVVTGDQPKQILIRAAGPALSAFGIGSPLANPTLTLFNAAGTMIGSNSGWNNDANVAAAGDKVGAFGFAANSKDAALLVTLQPGLYTAQVQSADHSGTVLMEVYDVSATAAVPTKQLINISTRGHVGTGDDVLIAGFSVSGNEKKKVLIRAVGPALTSFGVAGALSDPKITVYSANTVKAQNDNWGTPAAGTTGSDAAAIASASTATGAFPFATGSADAAVIVDLDPGQYSAVVTGANNSTGSAMVEVYEIPDASK